MGGTPETDKLVVFAEAFLRDADPEEFSLDAILAHERGHQVLVREPKLRRFPVSQLAIASEEILASLIGSLMAENEKDRESLFYKAVFETIRGGMQPTRALPFLHELRSNLGKILCLHQQS